jgi:hypothetical protein
MRSCLCVNMFVCLHVHIYLLATAARHMFYCHLPFNFTGRKTLVLSSGETLTGTRAWNESKKAKTPVSPPIFSSAAINCRENNPSNLSLR